jgi:hypothetical protein
MRQRKRILSMNMPFVRKTISLMLILLASVMMIHGSAAVVYAQFLPPPSSTIQQPVNPSPVTPTQQPTATSPSQFGGPGTGFIPPSATTFPPSVFPPTNSFLPTTSFAIPTGSLSPWFPSLPAVACGGTFSFTVIGKVSDKGEDLGNGKQRIAIQINSAGGIDLTQQSINGKIFIGQDNIDRNQGDNFNIKNVFNNCQGLTFSR